MGYTRVSLGLPPELLSKVDQARGDVPRERWLRRLVEYHFEQSHSVPPAARVETMAPEEERLHITDHGFKPRSTTRPFICFVCGERKEDHDR